MIGASYGVLTYICLILFAANVIPRPRRRTMFPGRRFSVPPGTYPPTRLQAQLRTHDLEGEILRLQNVARLERVWGQSLPERLRLIARGVRNRPTASELSLHIIADEIDGISK
jgi:hypothetical protein